MRSGYAPQTTGVPVGTVTVDGVAREATAVSTVRELGGGGVPGLSSAAAAEGSVEFGQLKNSDSGPAYSPWTRTGNWPPVPGSVVQVDAGTELESFRMLTGVIDTSSAGSDGIASASLIDPVDRLHRRVTLQALLSSMPPLEYGGPLRNIGLSSDFVADTLLRRCAYFSTPYLSAGIPGVNVTGQGSLWPERGTVVTAGQFVDQNLHASFLSTEWGWGIHNGRGMYRPDGDVPVNGAEIAVMVSDSHAATSSIRIAPVGSTALLYLTVNSDRSLSANYRHEGATTVICTLATHAYRRAVMRISAGSVTIETDTGGTVSGTNPAPSSVTSALVDTVEIRVPEGGRLGGIMVAAQPAGLYFGQTLGARLWAGTALNPNLLASPRVDLRDALAVLSEIAQATCRAFWWDEDGVFQWMPGDYLLVRDPTHTVTSTDSLIDLGWSEALADVARAVTVDHKTPAVSRSRKPNVPVWQGRGASIESGQTEEEIASPSTDEEWILPEWSPTLAGGSFYNDHNHGIHSVWGGVITDGTTTEWAWIGGYLTTSLQSIGPNAMKYTYSAGTLPAGWSAQTVMPNDAATTAMWARWRNEKLPILRAYGRVEWTGNSYVAGSGPAAASEYQHDGGKWVQGYTGETPSRVADFLAAWLTAPRINATGVRVVHDPRIQVGDVVTVRDEHAHGVELTALVTRVEQSVTAGAQDMVLDLYVIDGGSAWVTLGEHDTAQSGTTLAGHDTSQDGESLADHDQDSQHLA